MEVEEENQKLLAFTLSRETVFKQVILDNIVSGADL